MDVISVGMGRTGTLSLKFALEQLGYGPCYHMKEVMNRPDRSKAWRRVGEGAPADWDALYDGFRATVDWPGATYWRELVDHFPDAKIILNVRDPERWVDSAYKTVFSFPLRRRNRFERWLYAFFSTVNPPSMYVPRMLDTVWKRDFEDRSFNRPEDRQFAIDTFLQHNEDVKKYVPADRLLVYQISEGWEPLCSFLGVPVPETQFPQVNDTKEFKRDIAARTRRSVFQVSAGTTALVAVILGLTAVAGVWHP
jgi:hypothetical protein